MNVTINASTIEEAVKSAIKELAIPADQIEFKIIKIEYGSVIIDAWTNKDNSNSLKQKQVKKNKVSVDARTVDEAIEIALKKLNTTKDKITYNIIHTSPSYCTVDVEEKFEPLNLQRPKLKQCPDCGKEISRNAATCPHCGCPIEQTVHCPYCDYDSDKTYKEIQELGCKIICENCGKEVEVMTPQQEILFKMQDNIPRCPRCGSTAITAGARGANFTTGFIGASKTVNRCANCGHTWKP